MTTAKPILLLTTARSGSTPFYKIFEHYLALNHGIQGAEEILNPFYGSYWSEGPTLRFSESVNVLSLEAYQQSFHQRFDLARQLQGKLFFKVFPSCFREDTSEWLVNNHQFIASERKDLWEQVLSYLVSDATGQWYSETGINLAPHSLTATFKGFKTIERSVFHYQHLKKRLRPIASLSYEDDLLKKSASQILREVGLNGEFNQDFRQVQKQNMRPKEELFKNLEEIRAWYDDSFFAQLKAR